VAGDTHVADAAALDADPEGPREPDGPPPPPPPPA
jgi:hypothetical protein